MLRLRFILICFLTLFIIIIIKLFAIQVIFQDTIEKNNYLKTERIEPLRGQIYDINSNPLAVNTLSYKAYIEPQNINNKDTFGYILDNYLHIGEATVSAKLYSSKKWVPIASNISQNIKNILEKKLQTGLKFEKEFLRYYPEASLSGHILGIVGKDFQANNIGYFGIEGFYEKDLAGLPGLIKSEKDVFGKPILIGVQDVVKGENGRDLILTLDKNIQLIAKKYLHKGILSYGSKSGCVIIINPYTGAIAALTCLPDFDPSFYQNYNELEFKNPAISITYEPGSIFKPLIMAAALNEKKVKTGTLYHEKGPVRVGGHIIANWDDKYAGLITMVNVIEKSSNVGMSFVAKRLGENNIHKYLTKYHFGELTNIDLQGEIVGILKPKDKWYPVDYATVSFGQGIGVTQIQMISAFASIINGGNYYQPYIVSGIKSENGTIKKIFPKKINNTITKKTSVIIRKILQKAVSHGEVKWDIPKGYSFGGKTGTAQIPIDGKYDPSKTIASFIGFAPVSKPKFLMLVTLVEPTTSAYGSETAAPIFFEIARELLIYYNIAPDN